MTRPAEPSREGVLPVDKPEGPTSHDVVAQARRALGERRIGHTGTLDPFASGLLLLCVGRATRLAEYLTPLPKRYEAVAELGTRTDTDDRTGTVLERSEAWRTLAPGRIRDALLEQRGRRRQRPPVYSAKKVAGERLYRRARRGEPVEAEPVEVEIHSIELLELSAPRLRFEVTCSSGTYVRAIARDLGDALGVGAHLTALRRTAIGEFRVEDAVATDRLGEAEVIRSAWLEPLEALRHLPRVAVDEEAAAALVHGRPVAAEPGVPAGGPIALVRAGRLLGIGERRDGELLPRKVLAHA